MARCHTTGKAEDQGIRVCLSCGWVDDVGGRSLEGTLRLGPKLCVVRRERQQQEHYPFPRRRRAHHPFRRWIPMDALAIFRDETTNTAPGFSTTPSPAPLAIVLEVSPWTALGPKRPTTGPSTMRTRPLLPLPAPSSSYGPMESNHLSHLSDSSTFTSWATNIRSITAATVPTSAARPPMPCSSALLNSKTRIHPLTTRSAQRR